MKFAFLSLALGFSISAQAESGVYKLEVVRDGVTYEQVAGDTWQGEYPGPVIDVNSATTGTTTIQAWESLRTLDKPVSCTIQNGLYHPWSNTGNSVEIYYTITGIQDFKVTAPPSQDVLENLFNDQSSLAEAKITLAPGDEILNLFYYGEGWAGATLKQGDKLTDINFFYDIFETNPQFFELTKKTEALKEVTETYEGVTETTYQAEQWLYVSCSEGYHAFVEDVQLLTQPGVAEGVITGYGDIGPAGTVIQ